jgi:hypothetical protein
MQCNTQLLPDKGITLFSLSYKENNDEKHKEDGFLKVKVLYNSVYDEKALKEETEKINWLKEETPKINQKIKEIDQEIAQAKQKEIETELLTRKIEEDIKIKKAALQKMLS